MKFAKTILFPIILLFTIYSYSQFPPKSFDGKVIFNDGTEKNGKVRFPIMETDVVIVLKYVDGDKDRIPIEEVKFIEVSYGKGNKALLSIGKSTKYSKRKKDFVWHKPGYGGKSWRNVGHVFGIHDDLVLTRHGASYEIKRKRGEEQFFTVYNAGYFSFISHMDDEKMIPLSDIQSKKEKIRLRAINYFFTSEECRSIIIEKLTKDVTTLDGINEIIQEYADCKNSKND
ncbi:hypothetical protein BST97_10500 [Nonlabens spongiae]|uniref:Uncharacterized protein n=1 Tax=Nonlabens spongiae TaxID=331648 RepID=A0A1W6MLD0_9FLAO|nr:hypothetical protein [Nonlabens spongiae]ARN78382.1 hypothetical protein BST97_10500 [Nonlabens spongiae]